MKIFISGSISINRLDDMMIDEFKKLVLSNDKIIVSDADGIDWVVQKYFAKKKYNNVIIYYTGKKCRHNVLNWPEVYVENKEDLQGREMYTLKDRRMAEDADSGIIIWDGESIGTKNNILYMGKLNKKIKVYKP